MVISFVCCRDRNVISSYLQMTNMLSLAVGILLSGALSYSAELPNEQQVTNKPFYFHFGSLPPRTTSPSVNILNSDPVSTAINTATTVQTTDTGEPDLEPEKPTYQCLYHENTLIYCQELDKCRANRTEIVLADNRTFSGYHCDAQLVQIKHTMKSGIASRGFLRAMTAHSKSSDILFVCHFYADEVPSRQSFACAAPVDCRHKGALSPCAGAKPWYGKWTGDLELGLWGVVTNIALEAA